jgi:hypothetical protein
MNIGFLECVNSVISNCFVQIEHSCCTTYSAVNEENTHSLIQAIFNHLGNAQHKNSGALPFIWYSVSKYRLVSFVWHLSTFYARNTLVLNNGTYEKVRDFNNLYLCLRPLLIVDYKTM